MTHLNYEKLDLKHIHLLWHLKLELIFPLKVLNIELKTETLWYEIVSSCTFICFTQLFCRNSCTMDINWHFSNRKFVSTNESNLLETDTITQLESDSKATGQIIGLHLQHQSCLREFCIPTEYFHENDQLVKAPFLWRSTRLYSARSLADIACSPWSFSFCHVVKWNLYKQTR